MAIRDWQAPLAAAVLWSCGQPLYGQFLLVNRPMKNPAEPSKSVRFEGKPGSGFLADRFQIGAKGEVWVIDRLRLWGQVDGGRIERATLFGGVEATAPAPGEFECDCHNLTAIKSAAVKTAPEAAGSDVRISRAAASVWQLDFDHLNWSVPGGTEIQFGLAAARWSSFSVDTGTAHQLKVFDAKGKLLSLYTEGAPDGALGFAVQAWGHIPAPVGIRQQGEIWEVTLGSAAAFNGASADGSSLRFGPRGASPVEFHADGASLVASFRTADAGVGSADVNACLTGLRRDGVPFEGCGLLKSARVK